MLDANWGRTNFFITPKKVLFPRTKISLNPNYLYSHIFGKGVGTCLWLMFRYRGGAPRFVRNHASGNRLFSYMVFANASLLPDGMLPTFGGYFGNERMCKSIKFFPNCHRFHQKICAFGGKLVKVEFRKVYAHAFMAYS